MSEKPITAGPWFVGAMNDALFIINKPPRPSTDEPNHDADVKCIAIVTVKRSLLEMDANAHMLAASPELYEAVVMIRDADDDCERDGLPRIPLGARKKIDAALAKAEGRS